MRRLVYPSRTRAELGSGLLHQGLRPSGRGVPAHRRGSRRRFRRRALRRRITSPPSACSCPLLLANLGSEPRRPASPASLLARVCRAGANSSACCATVAARRGGRASPGRSTHRSRTRLVRRLQRQQLDGQRRSRRALFRPAKRASPRRRRPACSRSSDSGVFSASAAMPAPRAKPGRAGHDVSASLAARGLSTVVLKPFLSLAVR
jgi:hypothetical protein